MCCKIENKPCAVVTLAPFEATTERRKEVDVQGKLATYSIFLHSNSAHYIINDCLITCVKCSFNASL